MFAYRTHYYKGHTLDFHPLHPSAVTNRSKTMFAHLFPFYARQYREKKKNIRTISSEYYIIRRVRHSVTTTAVRYHVLCTVCACIPTGCLLYTGFCTVYINIFVFKKPKNLIPVHV